MLATDRHGAATDPPARTPAIAELTSAR